ncbi:hypothetical protein [Parvularcula oceani]|uniref:hypothetical protein n=1 Tax=Parvularcula oceani TaxID=1247963 RepID=UPI0004E1BD80|nr:hypothetical protein [Parvularcula oceani]
MLDRPAAKTAAAKAALAVISVAFARRYPASRTLVVLPLIQAGLSLYKARQRAEQVRKLRRRPGSRLRRLT